MFATYHLRFLRWHYPNQVQGLGDASYSQPASHASSPLLSADNYIRIKTIVQEKNGRFKKISEK